MSVFGKIGKFLTSPKGIGAALGGLPGLAAGALFDSKRGQYRTNRSAIEDAYRSAQQRQQVHEGDVRQGLSESLNARGLLTPGALQPGQSKIAAAMGVQSGYVIPSTTLGGREQAETDRELGLERHDLDTAHTTALRENKASYIDDLVKTGVSAATTAASLGSNLGSLGSLGSVASAAPSQQASLDAIAQRGVPGVASPISSAMGIDNSSNWWGGIHPIDPVNHPDSAWSKQTISPPIGTPNSDFHL